MKQLLFLALCALTAAAQQPKGPMTDQRVVNLAYAGLSADELVRVIRNAPEVNFDLTPAALDGLAKAGISDQVIRAMAARANGAAIPAASINHSYIPRPAVPVRSPDAGTVIAPVSKPIDGRVWVLHEGTPVRLRIMRTVSSADAQQGNNVDFKTLDDIVQNGAVLIPKGSTAIATITAAESKKRMGRGGKLGMNIDYVRLPNGDELPLRGVQNLKGGGHTGAMTGAIVATAIVFWPAAPFFLFMHGKDIVIPEGHEVTVYTNTDYKFTSADFGMGPL